MLKCRLGSYFLVFASLVIMSVPTVVLAESSKSLFIGTCSRCHSYKIVESQMGKTANQWIKTINKMKVAGLVISNADMQTIAKYLSKTYK